MSCYSFKKMHISSLKRADVFFFQTIKIDINIVELIQQILLFFRYFVLSEYAECRMSREIFLIAITEI